jgi:hypothetical protein
MRIRFIVPGALILAGAPNDPAGASKPPIPECPSPQPVPCALGVVQHNWEFAASDHDFTAVDCDDGGASVWEYGSTSYIPGAQGNVWGTILDADYYNNSGLSLVSPTFVVGGSGYLLEVTHYFDSEFSYDGCNVSVGVWPDDTIIEPFGGYTVSSISSDPIYYAYCVDEEPGWTGHDAQWRVDCFDLSEYMGLAVAVSFNFGSDVSVTAPGWYVASVRVGAPAPTGACCDLETGDCSIETEMVCLEMGWEWHPEWGSCRPNPCPQPIHDTYVEVGSRINPEPWHDWIGPAGIEIPVRVNLPRDEDESPIIRTEFFVSEDGMSWDLFAEDDDGSEPRLNTTGDDLPVGDGWGATYTLPEPMPEPTLHFKVVAFPEAGPPIEAYASRGTDPAPPSLGTTHLPDWIITDNDTLGVFVDDGGSDIERILVIRGVKGESFSKGIPGINQHHVSPWHCAPTATAECFRYFEAQGDPAITGGLNDPDLILALGGYMRTRPEDDGTRPSNWVGGTAGWIEDRGNNYTVRADWHFTRGGAWTWAAADWSTIRNELERCQDVLLGLFWSGGGGHATTLNSIFGQMPETGRMLLGFMDPWTGNEETGELDPSSGVLYNVTGSGGGGNAYVGMKMIVCPSEQAIGDGLPGDVVFDGLPPGDPPYHIDIPIPAEGLWYAYITLVNNLGHAHTITHVVEYSEPIETPDEHDRAPAAFYLAECLPNPFRTTTEISYAVPAAEHVSVKVYDVTGRLIRSLVDAPLEPGVHRTLWNGKDDASRAVAAGIYYVRMTAGAYEATRKVIVLE